MKDHKMNSTQPMSMREQLRQRDAIIQRLMVEGQENLYVLNALLWKLGIKNLQDALGIITEFTNETKKLMADKAVEDAKQRGATVIEGFVHTTNNEKK